MSRCFRPAVLCLALGFGLNFVTLLRAALPPAEKYLPDDTLAFVTVRDAAEAKAAFQQPPQFRAWLSPSMKPFRENFMAKLAEKSAGSLEKDLGLNLTNCYALAQGQVTLALTQNGWQGQDDSDPGWVGVLEAGTNASLLQTNLADIKKKWADNGGKFRTESVRGVEFSVFVLATNQVPPALQGLSGQKSKPEFADEKEPSSEPAAKPAAQATDLYLGQSGSLLLAGNSPKVLERVLANIAGDGTATVSEQANFGLCRPTTRDGNIIAWVNTKMFVNLANDRLSRLAGDAGSLPVPLQPSRMLAGLGVNGLKSLALSLRPTADNFEAELFLAVPESEREGLLKLFAGKPGEAKFPDFIPADVVKVKRWRFGGRQGWETLQQAAAQMFPQLAMGVDFMFAQAGGEEGGLKKQFEDNLGDELIHYLKAPRGKSAADLSTMPSLFLLASPQPDKLLASMKPLLSLASRRSEPAKEREFLGRKVYSVDLPPMRLRDGTAITGRKLSFAAASGYVAMTTDDALLEEFLRAGDTPGKSLRDTPGLADALAHASPGGASFVAYYNERETMRLNFAGYKAEAEMTDKLKQSSKPKKGDSGADGEEFESKGGPMADLFDAKLLPEFDTIAKYFHFEVVTLNAGETGLTLRLFDPSPPGFDASADAAK